MGESKEFTHARLKLLRGIRHIDELQACLVQEAADTDSYKLIAEPNANGGGEVLTLQVLKPLRPAYALCLGDAVHNMRAALDFVAYEVVFRKTGKVNDRIQFPCDVTRERLKQSSSYGAIERANADVARAIIDKIKPYKEGGSFDLWSLNKLDNIDKHRLLVPVLQVTAMVGVSAETQGGGRMENCTLSAIGAGKFKLIAFGGGGVKITNYGKPAFEVTFPEGEHFPGESVIPCLHRLKDKVVEAILTLERAYF